MERFCFVFILAFLLSPIVGHSQTRILIACRYENGGEKLSGLVERCAALALDRAGYTPVRPDPDPDGEGTWTLLAEASYLDGNYRLELSFLSPDGSQLSSTVLSGRLSLDFDVLLMDAVERIVMESGAGLAQATPAMGENPPLPTEPDFPAAQERQEMADLLAVMVAEVPAPNPENPAMPGQLPMPGEEVLASRSLVPAEPVATKPALPEIPPPDALSLAAGNAPPPSVEASEPAILPSGSLPGEGSASAVVLPSTEGRTNPLVIDAASGPVFVVGEASETFRYGFDIACRIGARLAIGSLHIDAALRTGYARLSPTGLVGGALHLVSLGAELGLVVPESAPLRFRCRVGAGPLYVAAEATGSGIVGKILPFCSAGLGLDLLPSPRFSIGLGLELMAVFERNEPLIALVPVLGVGWRF